MFAMRSAPAQSRWWWAALAVLALAMRLLTPAGYMPALEHGRLAIVVCDDGASAASAHHHHGKAAQHHEPCPYTSLSSFGAAGGEFVPVLPMLATAAPLLPWIAVVSTEARRSHERPPSRGPPLPA